MSSPNPHPPESRELWLVLAPLAIGVALCTMAVVCVLRPGASRAPPRAPDPPPSSPELEREVGAPEAPRTAVADGRGAGD